MPTASPSIGVIRAQIRAIRKHAAGAKVFGILTPGRWTGPSVHGEGTEQIAVYQCDSPLQMRLALQEAPQTASATVLLTPLDQAKVSDDILVRLALRKIQPINSWEIVRSLFNAKYLDPRFNRYPFLADLLLEHAANREFQPTSGGLVAADTVWEILLTERLGLAGAQPDLVELLRCSAESDLAARWQACSAEFRKAAREWITEVAGDAAGIVLNCLTTEHGPEALAIGLAMGVLYDDSVGHDLDKAVGRLEAYVGATDVPMHVAKRWRDAASVCAGSLHKAALRRCLDDAERILENVGASNHAWRSLELESGFEQRLSLLGQALTVHVDSRATAIPEEIQHLYRSVQLHRLGRETNRRMERIAMAIRLARWLADQTRIEPAKATGLPEASQKYVADGGFVDWARQVLRGGEPNKDLAAAFVRLVDRVMELREVENHTFGRALAEQNAAGTVSAGLIPVEQLTDRVVTKAAETAPVLVLLVDGMSWSVYRELAADIKSHGWIEVMFEADPRRLIGLAALPSVTEVCRASLLCGTLKRGQAADEVEGFASQVALAAVSLPSLPPRLFHKAALEGDEDTSLAGDIRKALADRKQRVVGIVINAVDDHLDKGDQIDAVWSMQHIRVLEPILAEAGAAKRLVILLSDHGHILDRQTEGREGPDGLRWRRPGASVTKEELEVASPRVLLPEGNRVVVPWSERLRYGAKKNGYHGGATPQEMLVPVGILWPDLQLPEGLAEMPEDLPPWWTEPLVAQSLAAVAPKTEWTIKDKAAQPTLFDKPEAAIPAMDADNPWIGALVQSEVFVAQKRLAGRAPVEELTVRRFIAVLASRGGSMTAPALASAIGVPEHRIPGLIAIMQRLLNVEGYAILDRQDAANTIVLNVPLLKKQFDLSE